MCRESINHEREPGPRSNFDFAESELMLTILGRGTRGRSFCDGISRRNFLTIGGFALGGISLAQVLRAESLAGQGHSHKAIINIYLPGGPSHLDMWDLKPEAPVEVRG